MGRNGAGKSTLLAALVGQLTRRHRRRAGRHGHAVRRRRRARARAPGGLVPQDPALLLYAESVAEECAAA